MAWKALSALSCDRVVSVSARYASGEALSGGSPREGARSEAEQRLAAGGAQRSPDPYTFEPDPYTFHPGLDLPAPGGFSCSGSGCGWRAAKLRGDDAVGLVHGQGAAKLDHLVT